MAIALDRPTLITPGPPPVAPSFESWWLRPGGATVVHVRPGDRMTVRDPDGGQPAEVTGLDAEGGGGGGALGAGGRGRAGRAGGGAGEGARRGAAFGPPPRRAVPRRAAPPRPQAARRPRDPA